MKDFNFYLEKVSSFYFEENNIVQTFKYHKENNVDYIKIGNKNISLTNDYSPEDFGTFKVRNYILYVKYNNKQHVININDFNINSDYSGIYKKEYDYTDQDHSEIFRKIVRAIDNFVSEKIESDFQLKGDVLLIKDRKSKVNHFIKIQGKDFNDLKKDFNNKWRDIYWKVYPQTEEELHRGEPRYESHLENFRQELYDFLEKNNII